MRNSLIKEICSNSTSDVDLGYDYAYKYPFLLGVTPGQSYMNKCGWHHKVMKDHRWIMDQWASSLFLDRATKEVSDFLNGAGFNQVHFLEQSNSTWRGDGQRGPRLQITDCGKVQEHRRESPFGAMSNLLGKIFDALFAVVKMLCTLTFLYKSKFLSPPMP